ncbi:MAG: hypothetical protein JSU65_01345, partial [Candidatus Zixiibacteriota bacterium]
MQRATAPIIVLSVLLMMTGSSLAIDKSEFNEVTVLMDSARVLQADVFAPKTWEKAARAHQKADESINTGKKQKSVDKYVAEAREYVENAIKATEVAKLSLEQYLPQRDRARQTGAPRLVPELYLKAEEQFLKATAKVESGDVKGALKEADKSTPLFDTAELEAIRADILGAADRLIEKAMADDAGKFALATLDKARTARTRSNAIITNDRYNRADAETEAALAEYEARHASNIALSVRALNRNDQAWEKLMLVYEIQMSRVGQEVGLGRLPFDAGPLAAADSLISNIRSLQSSTERATSRSADLSQDMTTRLKDIASLFGTEPNSENPTELARIIDSCAREQISTNRNLADQLEDTQDNLASLVAERDELSGELSGRLEKEEKFKSAKSLLNPSEGEILYNSANDIVLRLAGLSFDVGKSDIKDDHISLLEKVKKVIQMFPSAQYVIEG